MAHAGEHHHPLGEQYQRHSKELLHFASRATGNAEDAADLVHATFLDAITAQGTLNLDEDLRPFLFYVLKKKISRYWQAQKRSPRLGDLYHDADEVASQSDDDEEGQSRWNHHINLLTPALRRYLEDAAEEMRSQGELKHTRKFWRNRQLAKHVLSTAAARQGLFLNCAGQLILGKSLLARDVQGLYETGAFDQMDSGQQFIFLHALKEFLKLGKRLQVQLCKRLACAAIYMNPEFDLAPLEDVKVPQIRQDRRDDGIRRSVHRLLDRLNRRKDCGFICALVGLGVARFPNVFKSPSSS